jgi:AraC family transcriptional regulator
MPESATYDATPYPPSGAAATLRSAASYQSSFAAVGGRELEVLAKGGDASGVCVGLYQNEAYELFVPPMGVTRLSIALTACNLGGAIGSDRLTHCAVRPNAAFLVPEGADARWAKDTPGQHLNIYFNADAFDGADPDAPRIAQDLQLFNANVPGLSVLADALVQELDSRQPLAEEAADSLARLLLVRLSRFQTKPRTSRNPLSPPIMLRLREYVEAHLSEPILVADLAMVTGLSVHRFAHAFSEYCGRSPHQFVLCLRLARVLRLLRGTKMGIAEIAATTGFASQQHLTRTMRQRLNVTPGGYRERVRGASQ